VVGLATNPPSFKLRRDRQNEQKKYRVRDGFKPLLLFELNNRL